MLSIVWMDFYFEERKLDTREQEKKKKKTKVTTYFSSLAFTHGEN